MPQATAAGSNGALMNEATSGWPLYVFSISAGIMYLCNLRRDGIWAL